MNKLLIIFIVFSIKVTACYGLWNLIFMDLIKDAQPLSLGMAIGSTVFWGLFDMTVDLKD